MKKPILLLSTALIAIVLLVGACGKSDEEIADLAASVAEEMLDTLGTATAEARPTAEARLHEIAVATQEAYDAKHEATAEAYKAERTATAIARITTATAEAEEAEAELAEATERFYEIKLEALRTRYLFERVQKGEYSDESRALEKKYLALEDEAYDTWTGYLSPVVDTDVLYSLYEAEYGAVDSELIEALVVEIQESYGEHSQCRYNGGFLPDVINRLVDICRTSYKARWTAMVYPTETAVAKITATAISVRRTAVAQATRTATARLKATRTAIAAPTATAEAVKTDTLVSGLLSGEIHYNSPACYVRGGWPKQGTESYKRIGAACAEARAKGEARQATLALTATANATATQVAYDTRIANRTATAVAIEDEYRALYNSLLPFAEDECRSFECGEELARYCDPDATSTQPRCPQWLEEIQAERGN